MNIALLAQGNIAKKCIKTFHEQSYKNIFLRVIVTTENFYKEEIKDNFKDVIFISNNLRNEDLILSAIEKFRIDAIISVQHPWILSDKIIKAVDSLAFNLHNAKLPDYKGHNSISHAILNNEKFYTTTIHWLISHVDMGDIIFENVIPINTDETAYSLYLRTLQPAYDNFEKLIHCLDLGLKLPAIKIKEKGKFYKKNEIYALKEIKNFTNWDEIIKKYRAFYFYPHEPAFMKLGDKKIYPHLDLINFYKRQQ